MQWLKKSLSVAALMLGLFVSSQAAFITMEVNDTAVEPGDTFRYTISLDYDGSNGLLSNVEVNDTIPAGTTYVGGTVSPAAAQYPADGSTGETIIWRLGSNEPGIIGDGTTTNTYTAADTFASQDYDLNTGTVDWSSDWTEVNDDGDPTSGDIQINDGELDLEPNGSNVSIYREVDLSGVTASDTVSFKFEFYHNYLDGDGVIVVEASNDGGSNYTVLETLDKDVSEKQTFTYDLVAELGSVGAQTRIRFRETADDGNDGDRVEFNDVKIEWTETTSSGGATTVDIDTTKDSYINERYKDTNYDDDDEIRVYRRNNRDREGLVEWDLSSIPSGATITAATIEMGNNSSNDDTVNIHRITQTWAADTVTWNSFGTGGYDTSSDGTIDDGGGTSTSTDIKDLVQEWVDGTANNGVIFIGTNNRDEARFDSSHSSPAPILHVTYEVQAFAPDATTEIIPSSLLKTTDGTDTITVVMEINSSEADTDVTPSAMTIEGFDDASATCDGPPAAQDMTAGGSIQFTYTCTLTVGAGQGTVKFSADATGDTYQYSTGISSTVIVVPPLTFVVKADDPLTENSTKNSAQLSSYKPLGQDECFAISDGTSEIYKLDIETGAASLLGATGRDNIEALKFNLDYSVLYGIDQNTDISSPQAQLVSINQSTGAASLVGTIGTVSGSLGDIDVDDADGMSFDPITGELYASVRRSGNDLLFKINPSTGVAVTDAFGSGIDYLEIDSGIANIDDIDGMSFYPDGTLYAILNNGGTTDYLFTIDKADGTATVVDRVHDDTGTDINDIESLSFMPDGTLRATNGNDNPDGELYQVDRTNALMLQKGNIDNGGDYEGLSCVEADPDLSEEIVNEVSNEVTTTLPITIAYVYPQDNGGMLEIDFSTATETSNVGFNIYAKGKGKKKWLKLNNELIPGALDSLIPQDYHTTVEIPDNIKSKKIWISGVDVNGVEDRHGPFKFDRESGSKTAVVPVDWKKVNKQVKAERKVRKKAKKASRKATRQMFKDQVVHLDVKEDAVYHVTHEDLLAEDINLIGQKAKKIAISFRGKGVARYIDGLKKNKWTEESWLEFKGNAPKGRDAIYLAANRYQLTLNKKLVVKSEEIEPLTAKTLVFESNSRYSWTIPSEDPFYDTWFYTRGAGKPGSTTRTFTLSELPEGNVDLTVYLSALSLGQHNLSVSLNGAQIADAQDSGWKAMPIKVSISANKLLEGKNTITVTAEGENDTLDVFAYDKVTLSYDDGEALASKSLAIAISEKIKEKEIKPKRGKNYLMIVHPLFMGETLDRYVSQREGDGWNIQVVNVEDIYDAYGYGMATPDAIKKYLKVAKRKSVTHVQLVGAASFDYHDYYGQGSVSFIPSMYVHTGIIIEYTPSDGSLVADKNGIPQLAIGRWPVRTLEGFEAMVNKTLDWANSGQASAHTALLIADLQEDGADFAKQMDGIGKQFEDREDWNSVSRVYMDKKLVEANGDKNEAIAAAREEIIRSLNDGVSIVSFNGHSSLTKWSFNKLLQQSDAASVYNEGRTALALPMACYTTYADSPSVNTMAHQFLAKGENGFVAVYGAATLSQFSQNGVAATKVIDYLLKGKTIGEAIRKAKKELGVEYNDIIQNSNLLGDVTLKLK